MSLTKIDVLVPCAGPGHYVTETLQSIVEQTLPPGKVYMIDNACNHDVYRKAKTSSPLTIDYIRHEERYSLTRNWQRCLRTGDNPWVGFIHDDDIWKPEYLESIAKVIESKENVTLVLVAHNKFMDGTTPFAGGHSDGLRIIDELPPAVRSFRLATANVGHMSAMVFKRSAIGFHPSYNWMPDQEFLAYHLAYGKVEVIPETLVGIRLSPTQLTSSFGNLGINSTETIQHLRWVVSFWSKNLGLTPEMFSAYIETMNSGYLLRLLQACHSWPIDLTALDFAAKVISEKKCKSILRNARETRLMCSLPEFLRIALSFSADLKYLWKDVKAAKRKTSGG